MNSRDLTKTLAEAIKHDRPAFHADERGQMLNFSVSFRVIEELLKCVRPEMSTLETGCGLTTVTFALIGCQHCCITPVAAEAEAVKNYCDKIGIPRKQLNFMIGRSERILPEMYDNVPLDFVFIDGGHGFPYPIIDFFYVQHRVPVGGSIAIDDINIRSVRIVYDFMSAESEWHLVKAVEQSAIFKRVANPSQRTWADQRFNQVTRWERYRAAFRWRRWLAGPRQALRAQ